MLRSTRAQLIAKADMSNQGKRALHKERKAIKSGTMGYVSTKRLSIRDGSSCLLWLHNLGTSPYPHSERPISISVTLIRVHGNTRSVQLIFSFGLMINDQCSPLPFRFPSLSLQSQSNCHPSTNPYVAERTPRSTPNARAYVRMYTNGSICIHIILPFHEPLPVPSAWRFSA